MTISSEVQYFLLNLKTIESSNIFGYFSEFIKLVTSVFLQILSSLLSFSWLNDLIYRVNTLPIESINIINQPFVGFDRLGVFQEHIAHPVFFNPFISGCCNAFFLCLPLSLSHIYSLKETAVSNARVGGISFAGTLIGLVSYHYCIAHGMFFPTEQWVKGDSLIYLISLGIILMVIYNNSELELAKISSSRSISFQHSENWKKHLLIPFSLCWLEQIICFPYLNSIADPINNLYGNNNINNTAGYIVGFLLGAVLGITTFSFGFKSLCQFLWNIRPINPRIWRENVNTGFNIFMLILTFASIPYYTLDYLGSNALGFYSNEKIIQDNFEKQKKEVKKVSFLEVDNLDIESFDTQKATMQLPVEEVLYRGERDVLNRVFRQKMATEQNAKTFMENILRKLGVNTNKPDDKPKEKKETKTDSKKARLFQSTESPFVGRRFKQYSKMEINSPILNNIFTQSAFLDNSIFRPAEGITARIKALYYDNPVYRTLLRGDISIFLLNQPKDQFSSNKEFTDIIQTQKALKSYNDSLRNYKNLPYKEDFYSFFNGTKSFSNKLNSHQAKGSLRLVRRLFRIDVEVENNIINKNLRYDQPLFTNLETNQMKDNYSHEELVSNKTTQMNLTKWNPIPLYAGWDTLSREYLITNRYTTFNKIIQPTSKVLLTTFPYQSKQKFDSKASLNNILSIPNTDPRYINIEKNTQSKLNYTTIPVTATLYQKSGQFLPPDRGVFIWK